MIKHKLYETGDKLAPEAILDRNGEVVLGLCKVCGGAESSLPSECPGHRMTSQQLDSVSTGTLDYHHGFWIRND